MVVVIVLVLLRVFIDRNRLYLRINILNSLNLSILRLRTPGPSDIRRVIILEPLIQHNEVLLAIGLKNTFLVSYLNL
jgi:hypothetical protein